MDFAELGTIADQTKPHVSLALLGLALYNAWAIFLLYQKFQATAPLELYYETQVFPSSLDLEDCSPGDSILSRLSSKTTASLVNSSPSHYSKYSFISPKALKIVRFDIRFQTQHKWLRLPVSYFKWPLFLTPYQFTRSSWLANPAHYLSLSSPGAGLPFPQLP